MRKTALQDKLTLNSYSSNGKQTAKRTSDFIKFYAVLGLFKANSSKCLSALKTTTNNQEVKGSLYRLQNVNNFTL